MDGLISNARQREDNPTPIMFEDADGTHFGAKVTLTPGHGPVLGPRIGSLAGGVGRNIEADFAMTDNAAMANELGSSNGTAALITVVIWLTDSTSFTILLPVHGSGAGLGLYATPQGAGTNNYCNVDLSQPGALQVDLSSLAGKTIDHVDQSFPTHVGLQPFAGVYAPPFGTADLNYDQYIGSICQFSISQGDTNFTCDATPLNTDNTTSGAGFVFLGGETAFFFYSLTIDHSDTIVVPADAATILAAATDAQKLQQDTISLGPVVLIPDLTMTEPSHEGWNLVALGSSDEGGFTATPTLTSGDFTPYVIFPGHNNTAAPNSPDSLVSPGGTGGPIDPSAGSVNIVPGVYLAVELRLRPVDGPSVPALLEYYTVPQRLDNRSLHSLQIFADTNPDGSYTTIQMDKQYSLDGIHWFNVYNAPLQLIGLLPSGGVPFRGTTYYSELISTGLVRTENLAEGETWQERWVTTECVKYVRYHLYYASPEEVSSDSPPISGLVMAREGA